MTKESTQINSLIKLLYPQKELENFGAKKYL